MQCTVKSSFCFARNFKVHTYKYTYKYMQVNYAMPNKKVKNVRQFSLFESGAYLSVREIPPVRRI